MASVKRRKRRAMPKRYTSYNRWARNEHGNYLKHRGDVIVLLMEGNHGKEIAKLLKLSTGYIFHCLARLCHEYRVSAGGHQTIKLAVAIHRAGDCPCLNCQESRAAHFQARECESAARSDAALPKNVYVQRGSSETESVLDLSRDWRESRNCSRILTTEATER